MSTPLKSLLLLLVVRGPSQITGVLWKFTNLTAYDKALEISNNDINNSHIHAVQGMVAYKFGDIDGAKSSLFQRYIFLVLNIAVGFLCVFFL